MLLEQRQAVELRAADGHLEVVATARAILDAQLGGVGECAFEQGVKRFGGRRYEVPELPRIPLQTRGAVSNASL